MRSFDDVIDASIARRRLVVAVLAGFGLLALVLGAVGVYGVQSYVAGQRRNEFGIRLALGARARTILGHVLLEAATRASFGIFLGLGGAMVAGRLLRSQLYSTSPADPRSLVTAALALLAAAMLAAAGPAISAARTDPVRSMRPD
jgi:ABC-type antimicrobial peptide transport system permease subunit